MPNDLTIKCKGSKTERVSGPDVFSYTLAIVAGYYQFSLRALLKKSKSPRELSGLPDLARQVFEGSRDAHGERQMAGTMLCYFLLCIWGWLTYRDLRHRPPVVLLPIVGNFVGAVSLHSLALMGPAIESPALRLVHNQLLASSHEILRREAALSDHIDALAEYSGSSALRTGELELIAQRDNSMIKRYGLKGLERAFERQLSILMQSFGYYVVPALVGDRFGDLLCIAPASEDAYTVLLDAKSTAAPYSLPTADQRALREYVHRVKRNLQTLPQLRLVLIVGSAPSQSLENRLRELEIAAHVPVRFCPAQVLARLRGLLPGPVNFEDFLAQALESDPVLTSKTVDELVGRFKERTQSHVDVVRSLLGLASTGKSKPQGQRPPKPEW